MMIGEAFCVGGAHLGYIFDQMGPPFATYVIVLKLAHIVKWCPVGNFPQDIIVTDQPSPDLSLISRLIWSTICYWAHSSREYRS